MTPQDSIATRRTSPKREHVDSQPHFLDLCRMLGIDDPANADPAHAWFTFDEILARLFALNQARGGGPEKLVPMNLNVIRVIPIVSRVL